MRVVPSMPGTRRSSRIASVAARARSASVIAGRRAPPTTSSTRPSAPSSWAKPSSLSSPAPAAAAPEAATAATRFSKPVFTLSSRLAWRRRYANSPAAPSTSSMATANAAVSRSRIGTRLRRPPVPAEPVAQPADRLDRLQAERPVDLLAQVADVHLDDVRALLEAEVPGRLEQLHLRQHMAGVAHEGLQQRELARGQLDLAVAAPDRAGGRIEPERAGPEHGGPPRRRRAGRAPAGGPRAPPARTASSGSRRRPRRARAPGPRPRRGR